MKFFKEHNIFLKLLSLLIAIFLWSYVLLVTNPIKPRTFSNIVVEPIGLEVLEAHDLMLVNTEEPKVSVTVTGASEDVVSLSTSDIQVAVDFSDANIEKAGVYYLLPAVTVPRTVESSSLQPRRLQFTVENIVTKDVPVQVTTKNELPDNRLVDQLTPSQTTISIRGAESVVGAVRYALLTVDLENISRDMMQTCRVTLYTGEDALVDSMLVAPEQDALDVSIGLHYVATVPLSVNLLSSTELTRDMVDLEIVPETIRVYGPKSEIDRLTTLSLGNINLGDDWEDGQQISLSIRPPAGIRLMKDEPESARARLIMKTDVKRTLRVGEVALSDESDAADLPTVTLASGLPSVEVQGRADVIAGLTSADLLAEASFDSSELGIGTHTVPVRITAEQNGVEVISENLTIQISIEEPEEIEP